MSRGNDAAPGGPVLEEQEGLGSVTASSFGTQTRVCRGPGKGFAGAHGAAWDWPDCASLPLYHSKPVVSPGLERVVLI